ncbi:P-loop containing nucleoside triphosphate hydrolase protein [Aspergillus floccosus]
MLGTALWVISNTTCISLVALLSIPALWSLVQRVQRKDGCTQYLKTFYEDKDGEATETSLRRASSLYRAKLQFLVFMVTGGSIVALLRALFSISTVGDEPGFVLGTWLQALTWVLILIQYLSLLMQPVWTARFTLGWKGLAILVIPLSLSLPQRPEVLYQGLAVDREKSTSILGRLVLSWASDMITAAARSDNRLRLDDLPQLDHQTRAKSLQEAFLRELRQRTTDSKETYGPRLWRLFFGLHGTYLAIQWILCLPLALLSFLPHVALSRILQLMEERSLLGKEAMNTAHLCFWVVGIGVGIRVLEELTAAVFNKTLCLSNIVSSPLDVLSIKNDDLKSEKGPEGDSDCRGQLNTQGIINLVAVDGMRISYGISIGFYNILEPMKIIIACVFLWQILGWKPLVTGALCLYIKIGDTIMALRDSKLATLTEAIHGVRQVKFAALECTWEGKINALRDRELSAQARSFHWRVLNECLWLLGPILITVVSLSTYIWLHDELPAHVAFTALALLHSVAISLATIPTVLSPFLDTVVSVRRVNEFLCQDEKSSNANGCYGSIRFANASISWSGSRTGAGKSLLLAAILGECEVHTGIIMVPRSPSYTKIYTSLERGTSWIVQGAKAYVPQEPWIEATTVRNNILFGLPLNTERYNEVLFACALIHDLRHLEKGDQTELGSRGFNLSGGQKARIALARAIYSRAEILILDDIFSSVDVHTSQHLFAHALMGKLAVGRTRILATHNVGLCFPSADYVVYLHDGGLQFAGAQSEAYSSEAFCGFKYTSHTNSSRKPSLPPVLDEDDSDLVSKEEISFSSDSQAVRVGELLFSQYFRNSGGWRRWGPLFGAFLAYTGLILAQLLFVILRAPLQWLDTVPVGDLLNRFSSDFSRVDSMLGYNLQLTLAAVVECTGVILAGIIVSPAMIVLSTALLGCCIWYARRYLVVAQQIKAIEAAYRGPIYELFNALVLGVRTYSNLDMDMNAVKQVTEYLSLQMEDFDRGADVPLSWPSHGRLEIRDLNVRYGPGLPPVIQRLRFNVESGQRIGIVGRTGAGKSSLVLALFRFLEIREGDGQILIDGVDISSIKLETLRSRLTIIPQNPVLFAGTIRSNLDPRSIHDDSELLRALQYVSWTPALDASVREGGSNFSVGQRQLLCLARAMITSPRILVLDESTSAVDRTTDDLIQRAVRSNFSGQVGPTLLVIAHRISNVVDFDKILVLDAGRAVEFGSPRELMGKSNGVFKGMVEKDADREHLWELINSHR